MNHTGVRQLVYLSVSKTEHKLRKIKLILNKNVKLTHCYRGTDSSSFEELKKTGIYVAEVLCSL